MDFRINTDGLAYFCTEKKEERKFNSNYDKFFNYYLPLGIVGSAALLIGSVVIPIFSALSCLSMTASYISNKYSVWKVQQSQLSKNEQRIIILSYQMRNRFLKHDIKIMTPLIIPLVGLGFVIYYYAFFVYDKKKLVGDLAEEYNALIKSDEKLKELALPFWEKERMIQSFNSLNIESYEIL